MTIARYENFTVNRLTFGVDSFGQYSTTITKWFETRGRVRDVKNTTQITKDDRVYSDLTNFTVNYTPWTKEIVDNQNLYSITWRGNDWRITDCIETNDRMNVIFMCYRNDPVVPV